MDQRDQRGEKASLAALVIDTPSAFARGWFASQNSPEILEAGLDRRQAAVCSALMVLLPLISGSHLDQLYPRALYCWDGAPKTVKPRPPKPEGWHDALQWMIEVLPALVGGAHVLAPEHESDDSCATAAWRLHDQGIDSCVVSGDKDLHQIATAHVRYYCLNRKSILSHATICERWGIRHPSQVATALAVIGDPDDGVDGVPGCGKVWVKRFFAEFPSTSLTESMDCVAAALPESKRPAFYTAVSQVLLSDQVPDVPDPAPTVIASPEVFDDLGLGYIARNVERARANLELAQRDPVTVASSVDAEY